MTPAVKDGLLNYGSAAIGKGKLTGQQFADECRKIWSDSNKVNLHYYKLFERYVVSIEYKKNGRCKVVLTADVDGSDKKNEYGLTEAQMREKVTITCYRETETMTRRKAIRFYRTGMMSCDPGSSECERYTTIYCQLTSGCMECSDGC